MSDQQPKPRNSRFWIDLEPDTLEKLQRIKTELAAKHGKNQSNSDAIAYLIAQYFLEK